MPSRAACTPRLPPSTPSALALALAALALPGCATSHPRAVGAIDQVMRGTHTVAVLRPDLEVAVKYIGTGETFTSRQLDARCTQLLEQALARVCRGRGYEPVLHRDVVAALARVGAATPRWRELRERAEALSTAIILADPSYEQEHLPPCAVPALPVLLPPSHGCDAVLFVWGEAVLETDEETFWRFVKNITWNLAMLPVSIASAFVPLAMPLTISVSTSFFEHSPDRVWMRALLLDPRTGAAIYHGDFYLESVKLLDRAWDTIAGDLLEGLPDLSDTRAPPH